MLSKTLLKNQSIVASAADHKTKAAGVVATRGCFDRGDTVSVVGPDGCEVARGICAYSDADAARILGRRSGEIERLLGFRGRDEMIHRDDLAILRAASAGHTEATTEQALP